MQKTPRCPPRSAPAWTPDSLPVAVPSPRRFPRGRENDRPVPTEASEVLGRWLEPSQQPGLSASVFPLPHGDLNSQPQSRTLNLSGFYKRMNRAGGLGPRPPAPCWRDGFGASQRLWTQRHHTLRDLCASSERRSPTAHCVSPGTANEGATAAGALPSERPPAAEKGRSGPASQAHLGCALAKAPARPGPLCH